MRGLNWCSKCRKQLRGKKDQATHHACWFKMGQQHSVTIYRRNVNLEVEP